MALLSHIAARLPLMRILYITHSRIGDAVLSTGLLDHLLRAHPDARITIACGPVAAPLFGVVPRVERIIALDKNRWKAHWLRLWLNTVAVRWDLVVDLRRSVVTWLVPARRRASLPRSRSDEHRVIHIARTLGLENAPPAPRLWSSADGDSAASQLLPVGAPVLGVGPTANWRGKTWRADRFAALVRRLIGPRGILPGARVAVFGAASEREMAEPVLASVPAAALIDLVGKLDLPTAYECLRRCAFYVGNDSGLMHMAAAAGVPTLGLFGPSHSAQYAPWGVHTAHVRTTLSFNALVGGPDYDHRTTDTLMDSLSVDMAAAAARRLWRRTQGQAA